MRVANLLALLGVALTYLAAPAAEPAKAEAARFAFGALDKLQTGAVWTYRARVPKGETIGSVRELTMGARARPPGGPQDYETRLIRLTVTEVVKDGDVTAVLIRIEQQEPPDPLAGHAGPFEAKLTVSPNGCTAEFERDHRDVSGRLRYNAGQVPILCYPPLRAASMTHGEKTLEVQPSRQILRGFQTTLSPDGASVTVEAREYILMSDVASAEEIARQKWTEFYDAEAEDIVMQPREDRALEPLELEAYEIQEWDAGQPLPRHISRRTARGLVIMSCELISGADGAIVPPKPVPAPPLVRPGEEQKPAAG